MQLKLRPWQVDALKKSERWLLGNEGDSRFLINAAPGSGKTLVSCAIAKMLIDRGEIDRVVVIAPRREVVSQWSKDFEWVTGRFMGKITARDGDISELGMDVCATWSAVQGLLPEMQATCRTNRVLVICDEHHHAAVEASWGVSADGAFAEARFALILTGTPIRSDGAKSVWLAYDDAGAIDHPEEGAYTLTYGEAVDLGYCRPVTFHRHEGEFTVDLDGDSAIHVSGNRPAELSRELLRIPGLQRTLNFYRLACLPRYEKDRQTPLASGYQASVIRHASEKLDELRYQMPDAGGLVIAPSIDMAEYFAEVIELCEGERPAVVHSDTPNAQGRIGAFRHNDKRWLVSVAMVSEGVDIKRLRVLVYLPPALTELAFRQAIGRVVRTLGPNDLTTAYVVMPAFETFDAYARRVEAEMTPSQRQEPGTPRLKKCPVCRTECPIASTICPECQTGFPATRRNNNKACLDCGSLNAANATKCQFCGVRFESEFSLTLDDVFRDGVIARGMDIEESQALEGEKMAPIVRADILASGDETLIRIVKTLPDQSWGRLQEILARANSD